MICILFKFHVFIFKLNVLLNNSNNYQNIKNRSFRCIITCLGLPEPNIKTSAHGRVKEPSHTDNFHLFLSIG